MSQTEKLPIAIVIVMLYSVTMNVYLHTALAVGCMLLTYLWGRRQQQKSLQYQAEAAVIQMNSWIQHHQEQQIQEAKTQPELFDMRYWDSKNDVEPGILTLKQLD